MTIKELKKKEALIKKANDAYYIDNNSIMSDSDYDTIVAEIQQYYKDNNLENRGPTAKVGSSLSSMFNKVEHKVPMLSLGNTYSVDELYDFLSKLNFPEIVLEQKIDGLSCHLTYKDGKLVQAVTRGDGKVGEDVTENVLASPLIIKELPEKINIEIRGEVYIGKDDFKKINDEADVKYATSRNLASGSLRLKDSSLVADRKLNFIAYYIVNYDDFNIKTQSAVINTLIHLGFMTPNIEYIPKYSKEDIEKSLNGLKEHVDAETDGVVCKVNDISKWSELGNTAKTPRWAIAYKYPTEEVKSVIRSVTWQVGRTGRVTPVAEIDPIIITGTTVSRATLNNPDYIKQMDLKINDVVVVKKAAEIIPQIVYPVHSERSDEVYPITIPEWCPDCGASLKIVGPNIYCPSDNCPAKIKGKIAFFASKKAMDINGLGESIVEELYDLGYLTCIEDIYKLHQSYDELIKLENWGEKSVKSLLKAIEDSKKKPFDRVLVGLGISSLGNTNTKRLLSKYTSWSELVKASVDDIMSIKGIGQTNAMLIKCGLLMSKPIMAQLKEYGLNMSLSSNKRLNGLKVSITGTINGFTRDELTKYVEENLECDVVSVGKQTNILLLGKGYSESKRNKVGNECQVVNLTDVDADDVLKVLMATLQL